LQSCCSHVAVMLQSCCSHVAGYCTSTRSIHLITFSIHYISLCALPTLCFRCMRYTYLFCYILRLFVLYIRLYHYIFNYVPHLSQCSTDSFSQMHAVYICLLLYYVFFLLYTTSLLLYF